MGVIAPVASKSCSAEGDFRFYAAPGTWAVRALSRAGNVTADRTVASNGVVSVNVLV